MQILAQAMPKISPSTLSNQLRKSPNGAYIRTACYLWEAFTGQRIEDIPSIGGAVVDLFDQERYITGPAVRNSRWRVNFNGLGSIRYCPTVERTGAIVAGIKSDILGRARDFVDALGSEATDRVLAWAYLSETDSSFAIERETPTEDKSRTFVTLLQQAHERRMLNEGYLVELQSSTVSNIYDKATCFRHEQNWLRGPLRGAAGITYVPPPPGMLPDLMQHYMNFANSAPAIIDPIVAASVSSFGFVFLHPFMDGNGRLSRFLFHHALCQSGKLEKGLLLPVSVAMKRNEQDYLSALQAFSRPARNLWAVHWIDEDQYDFQFHGDASIYRYWDATKAVEFGFAMAEQALDVDLRKETEFLAHYDEVSKAVNERFDVRNSDLATLVISCLQNNGVVSRNRRKQFTGRIPESVFDFLEKTVHQILVPSNDN